MRHDRLALLVVSAGAGFGGMYAAHLAAGPSRPLAAVAPAGSGTGGGASSGGSGSGKGSSGGSTSTGSGSTGSGSTGSGSTGSGSTGSGSTGSGSAGTGSAGTGSKTGTGSTGTGTGGGSTSSGATRSSTGQSVNYGYGVLSVKATVTGTHIDKVAVAQIQTAEQYSQQLAAQVDPMLASEVLQAQSSRIQGISGATYTSEAYAMSLQSALSKLHVK